MTNFETIKKQALGIARHENERRRLTSKSNELKFTAFDMTTYSPPVGKKPVRAWAELAAPQITFDQWSDIAYHCADTVKPFRGCVISFMECAFDGLQMKDGSRVWA
jgi:hypothetical protein